jgi:signal transduction histidine kinase
VDKHVSAIADDETHFPTFVRLLCSRVQDTGVGITPAQLATLFKSFSQSVCIHFALQLHRLRMHI